MDTLGDEYSEDAIRAIIKGQKVHQPKKRRAVWETNRPQTIIFVCNFSLNPIDSTKYKEYNYDRKSKNGQKTVWGL